MDLLKKLVEKAKNELKTIAFPESLEERTLKAVKMLIDQKVLKPVLVGKKQDILVEIDKYSIQKSDIQIVDTEDDKNLIYAEQYYEMRKHKGMTLEKAQKIVKNPIFLSAFLVKNKVVDGYVCGAITSTGDTYKPALHIIKTKPGIKTAATYFIMIHSDKSFGDDGVMIFADCALMPNPDSEQLADIAISVSDSAARLLGMEPRVAMLSFSTKGSASHPDVTKVKNALDMVAERRPDIDIDGPLQFDAALLESVGKKKCPDSKIAGKANIFIFPDLNSGNIGYKIAQRLGGASAIGPVTVGLNGSVNDLSRGCSVEDVFHVGVITALL
ncbi:phosphate acetyltransferase [bacterium]|nr:phosphate acetyltransferase [bacterium]